MKINLDRNITHFIQSTFHKGSYNDIEQLNKTLKLLKYYIETNRVDTEVELTQLFDWWMDSYFVVTSEETSFIKLYEVCEIIREKMPNKITNPACIQLLKEKGVTIIEKEGIKYCSNLHKIT